MPATAPAVAAVIFDVDATLLDVAPFFRCAARQVLTERGVHVDARSYSALNGCSAAELAAQLAADPAAAAALPEEAALAADADALAEPLLGTAKPLLGAMAAVRALLAAGTKVGLVTRRRRDYAAKAAHHGGWLGGVGAVVAADDEVGEGGSARAEAARQLGVEPASCLAVEGGATGVVAALAAGMRAVAVVPSSWGAPVAPVAGAETTASSLSELRFAELGCAAPGAAPAPTEPRAGWGATLPLPGGPVFVSGEVVHGFGRGSTQLGFPTANLAKAALAPLAGLMPGVYCGFARVHGAPSSGNEADRQVQKMVMSLGWNPQFDDIDEKVAEPYIIHTFADTFYGQQLSLLIVAYVRPETSFASMEDLVSAIQGDVGASEAVLAANMSEHAADERLAAAL